MCDLKGQDSFTEKRNQGSTIEEFMPYRKNLNLLYPKFE